MRMAETRVSLPWKAKAFLVGVADDAVVPAGMVVAALLWRLHVRLGQGGLEGEGRVWAEVCRDAEAACNGWGGE